MILIDIFFPCLSLFLRVKIFAGLIAMTLQFSLFFWILATIWAILARRNAKNEKRLKELERSVNLSSQSDK